MTLGALARAACLVLLAAPGPAPAQERGRTDGSEGSEVGKGGYQRPPGGRLSLGLEWGASFKESMPLGGVALGPPLFVGLTASMWTDDWFAMDGFVGYLADSGRIEVLVGPRFRTGFYPVSFSAGLKAGLIHSARVGPRFGVSPTVGADLALARHLLLGLNYAVDVPVEGDGVGHRAYLNVGYRF
ncbi:MAG: hypothetical protein ACYC8T_02995 [Myxococcaceae bacterium]